MTVEEQRRTRNTPFGAWHDVPRYPHGIPQKEVWRWDLPEKQITSQSDANLPSLDQFSCQERHIFAMKVMTQILKNCKKWESH